MTARMKHQGLDCLADVLVEDILSTPDDQLLAEVAEDCGNARALADTFDKIVFRAKSSHDRLAAKASPIATNQVLSGPPPKNQSSRLAEKLGALWHNVTCRSSTSFSPIAGRDRYYSACIARLQYCRGTSILQQSSGAEPATHWHTGFRR